MRESPNQCPLLAQSGHGLVRCTCPLLGVKQTSERCPNVRTIVVSVQVRLRDLFIARVGDFTCHIGNGLRSNVPTYANNAKVPAMSGVAHSVELYNSAYRLAWQKISEGQKREQSDMAQRLHDFIARQIKEGASVDVLIASEALKELTILSDSSNQGGMTRKKSIPGRFDSAAATPVVVVATSTMMIGLFLNWPWSNPISVWVFGAATIISLFLGGLIVLLWIVDTVRLLRKRQH